MRTHNTGFSSKAPIVQLFLGACDVEVRQRLDDRVVVNVMRTVGGRSKGVSGPLNHALGLPLRRKLPAAPAELSPVPPFCTPTTARSVSLMPGSSVFWELKS